MGLNSRPQSIIKRGTLTIFHSLNFHVWTHFRMSVGLANLSLDLGKDDNYTFVEDFEMFTFNEEGNITFLEDFEVFTFRDAINVAAYMAMSAGQGIPGRKEKMIQLRISNLSPIKIFTKAQFSKCCYTSIVTIAYV